MPDDPVTAMPTLMFAISASHKLLIDAAPVEVVAPAALNDGISELIVLPAAIPVPLTGMPTVRLENVAAGMLEIVVAAFNVLAVPVNVLLAVTVAPSGIPGPLTCKPAAISAGVIFAMSAAGTPEIVVLPMFVLSPTDGNAPP